MNKKNNVIESSAILEEYTKRYSFLSVSEELKNRLNKMAEAMVDEIMENYDVEAVFHTNAKEILGKQHKDKIIVSVVLKPNKLWK